MKDEGFTQRQIDEMTNKGQRKGDAILRKAIGRWKTFSSGPDGYLQTKMFDRWRQYVHMRKIVKYWLNFIENRQQLVKSDLSYAFNKWKHSFSDKHEELQKLSYAELKRRAAMAGKVQEELADITQLDEDTVLHLNDQNDELFNNYKKAKRLALALSRDNMYFAKVRSFNKFEDHNNECKGRYYDDILGRNIEMIAALKDKIKEVENDNEDLAASNEELRQFSLDGYEFGKRFQSLTQEREKLSVDLADKTKTIKQLLDENERLSMRLRQAQDSAVTLARRAQKA